MIQAITGLTENYRKNMRAMIWLVFLLCIGYESKGQENEYYVIRDFRSEWLIYDPGEEALVPYLEDHHGIPDVIYFIIPLQAYMASELAISVPSNTGVFIDNQLTGFFKMPQEIRYRIDSLHDLYQKDSLLFSIHSPENLDHMNTRLITISPKLSLTKRESPFFQIAELDRPVINDFMKMAVLLVIFYYTFVFYQERRGFLANHNLLNTFSRVSTDDYLDRSATITGNDLRYFIGIAIVISLSALLIMFQQDPYHSIIEVGTIGRPFLIWMILLVLIFLWLMIRIFWISILTDLFMIREIKVIHIYENLRITNFFSLVFFLFILLGTFVFEMPLTYAGKVLGVMVVGLGFLRILLLSAKFLNSTTYKKLYLFTYLCTAELIPLLIGLKYLLKSSFIEYFI